VYNFKSYRNCRWGPALNGTHRREDSGWGEGVARRLSLEPTSNNAPTLEDEGVNEKISNINSKSDSHPLAASTPTRARPTTAPASTREHQGGSPARPGFPVGTFSLTPAYAALSSSSFSSRLLARSSPATLARTPAATPSSRHERSRVYTPAATPSLVHPYNRLALTHLSLYDV
jgi:hypothetical protein